MMSHIRKKRACSSKFILCYSLEGSEFFFKYCIIWEKQIVHLKLYKEKKMEQLSNIHNISTAYEYLMC